MSIKKEQDELPDGIDFDGEIYWSTCPDCGYEQADISFVKNVDMGRCQRWTMKLTLDKLGQGVVSWRGKLSIPHTRGEEPLIK